MIESKTNKSSQYIIYKKPLYENEFTKIYNAKNKQTNEIWIAKVIDMNFVDRYFMNNQIEYNRQVFQNLQNSQHFLYLKQVFSSNKSLFFIQQKYQYRLSQYIQKKGYIEKNEIQTILISIFAAICHLYENKYVHRCLRSVCIVYVSGEIQGQGLWKMQSVVYSNQFYGIDSQMFWNGFIASQQQKNHRQKLTDEELQAQILWQIGILTLEMILGDELELMKDNKQTLERLNWNLIQQRSTKKVYQMLQYVIKLKIEDRIELKDFIHLNIFQNIQKIGNMKQYFITASKIYKTKVNKSIEQKSELSNPIIIKQVRKIKQFYNYFKNINQFLDQISSKGDKSLIKYLFQMISYNKVKSFKNSIQKQNESLEFSVQILAYSKTSQGKKTLKQFQQMEKKLKDQILNESIVINQEMYNQTITLISNEKLKQINIQTSYENILDIFGKVIGELYTKMKDQDKQSIRYICYYSYAVCLTYLYNQQEFKQFNGQEFQSQNLLEYVQYSDQQQLAKNSQKLIKQYFQVAPPSNMY